MQQVQNCRYNGDDTQRLYKIKGSFPTPEKGCSRAQLRTQLGLKKQKNNKADAVIKTHAVDGITLACS
ncbi:MAG: hypothetical protein AAF915_06045 [Cyanobacteria bacterium P01_D01_bin.50]